MKFHSTIAIAMASMAVSVAHAQPHAGDIVLAADAGSITTGSFETGEFVSECVFGMALNTSDQANDPGFDSASGAFPSNAVIGPNIRKALRVWENGSFDTIPDEQIEIRWGPLGPVTSPTTDVVVDGSGLGLGVNSNGQYHTHYVFKLTSPADAGVYLLELEFWISPMTLANSEPFWMVIATHDADPQAFEDAVQYVRDNIAWCSATCVADWDGNDMLNTADFVAYLNDYNAVISGGSPTYNDPDLAAPTGVVNTADFIAFLNAYVSGCS